MQSYIFIDQDYLSIILYIIYIIKHIFHESNRYYICIFCECLLLLLKFFFEYLIIDIFYYNLHFTAFNIKKKFFDVFIVIYYYVSLRLLKLI